MPEIKPRTKAPKAEQLDGILYGELAIYEKVGLFQQSLSKEPLTDTEDFFCNIRKP